MVGARADIFRGSRGRFDTGNERQEVCGIADFADFIAGMFADFLPERLPAVW